MTTAGEPAELIDPGSEGSRPYDDAQMTPRRSDSPRTRPQRRRRWPWVLGVFAVLAVWAAFTAVSLNHARQRTQAGIDRLHEARDVLSPAGLVRGQGIGLLRAAETDFASARQSVRSPLVAPLRFLPVVGRQVRSVEALTGAAKQVVHAGVDAITLARDELRRTQPQGHGRVVIVSQLGKISAQAHQRIAAVDLGPKQALIGPLNRARERFAVELRKLSDATARSTEASRGMAKFLAGPSTYLVFAANNNEMRVGSGTFLSVGQLEVRDGSFNLGPMTPTEEFALPRGAVPVTGDFGKRWGWLEPTQEWRNLASSPIFPTQAALAKKMWVAAGKAKVDGVLALDPVALRALIEATHPVQVGGKQYGPANVLQEIYLYQYAGISGYPTQIARRDRLSEIARAAIENLQGKFKIADLVDALRGAADGRHVLGWSSDAVEQRGFEAAGVAGTLGRDAMLLGVHNRGGNKLDQFLDVTSVLKTHVDRKGTAVTVAVRLHNVTPGGLPQYVTGPYPNAIGSEEGKYQGLLVAELPFLARDMYITDASGKRMTLAAVGPDERSYVAATFFEARRGQTVEATVHFRLPPGDRTLVVEPSARVPSVEWSNGGSHWTDGAPHSVAW